MLKRMGCKKNYPLKEGGAYWNVITVPSIEEAQ